jgi:hypothetical protein
MKSLTWFVRVVVVVRRVVAYLLAAACSGSTLDPHFQKWVYWVDVVHVTNSNVVILGPEELSILT